MIYFSFSEFLKACAAFFILGASFAFFASVFWILPKLFGYIIKCISVTFSGSVEKHKSVRPTKILPQDNGTESENTVVFDFLFTLVFGVSFIIFSYVFLDGHIRLFCAVISIASYMLFKKRTEKLGSVVLFYFSILLFYLLKPFVILVLFIRNLIKFVYLPFLYIIRYILHAVFALKKRIYSVIPIDKLAKK